jgi:hypothetical protein
VRARLRKETLKQAQKRHHAPILGIFKAAPLSSSSVALLLPTRDQREPARARTLIGEEITNVAGALFARIVALKIISAASSIMRTFWNAFRLFVLAMADFFFFGMYLLPGPCSDNPQRQRMG